MRLIVNKGFFLLRFLCIFDVMKTGWLLANLFFVREWLVGLLRVFEAAL